MYEIIQKEIEHQNSIDLHAILVGEWPDFDAFEKERNGVDIPNPVIVLDQNIVIGGASFVRYKAPDTSNIQIWLNALFIDSKYRKQGIATRVLRYLRQINQAVYALTDVPDLYTKCGWVVVKNDTSGTIVKLSKT